MRFILVPLVAGVILAILAPFQTDNFPTAQRFTYWIGLCVAGGVGAVLFDIGLLKLKPELQGGAKLWPSVLAQSIGATFFVAAFLFALQMPYNLLSAVISIFYIWVIAVVISGVGGLLRSRSEAAEAAPESPANTRPALYERLAPKLRQAEIYAIASEDHYVRVYTSAGEEMILMRLSDAVKETSPLAGLSPHRSWWVAEAGVEQVNRKDGKTSLTLKNGITAPVSRNGSKAVKAAGWT